MAGTYPPSSNGRDYDRRRPLYGGFESEQWVNETDRRETIGTIRSNSKVPLSPLLQSQPDEQSPHAKAQHRPFRPFQLSSISNKFKMSRRPRGESDLGRPNGRSLGQYETNGNSELAAANQHFRSISETTRDYPFVVELSTAILVPLPFILASFVINGRPLLAYASQLPSDAPLNMSDRGPKLLQACALASATLLGVALLGVLRPSQATIERRKSTSGVREHPPKPLTWTNIKLVLKRVLSVLLPYIAVVELGGTRVAVMLLTMIAAGVIPAQPDSNAVAKSLRRTLSSRRWTFAVYALSFALDILCKQPETEYASIIRGYAALAKASLYLQPPLPTFFPHSSPLSAIRHTSVAASQSARQSVVSILVSSPQDSKLTLIAGAFLACLTVLLTTQLGINFSPSSASAVMFLAAVASSVGLLSFSQPSSLRSNNMAGFVGGLLFIIAIGLLTEFQSWLAALILFALSSLSYAAAQIDTGAKVLQHHHSNAHEHHHAHVHQLPSDATDSKFTQFLLRKTEGWKMLHSILSAKDSRSILYFLCVNFAFMLVQLFYSIVSESLGLMSDSIHMFFDCFGMAVGLFAAVMTKWPASDRFPFGFGKVNTLSGFANGVFLIFVSVEFIWDSFERFWEGVQLKRMEELFIVSSLGLIVNLIGLKLTHGHHGHEHGHDHSHGRSHDHVTTHEHSHDHAHAHEQLKQLNLAVQDSMGPPITPLQQSHDHHHDDENMLGIYLHILADTMGSVAVIISTALTYLTGYSFWDPIASCIIAVLIIASSYPLVRDSAKKLLLTVPSSVEWKLRETLQELSDLRGVVGYGAPRFWMDDSESAAQASGSCGQAHGHANHDHGHDIDENNGWPSVLGVIHVVASGNADLEDVRLRTCEFLKARNMKIVVHVEREGSASRCWCGGDKTFGPPLHQ